MAAYGAHTVPHLDPHLDTLRKNLPFFWVIMMVLVVIFWMLQGVFYIYIYTQFMAVVYHAYEETYPHM